jgi:hypothetical protein
MTVAFYSKKNKINQGALAEWKEGLKLNKKNKQKGKRKVVVVEDD